MITQVNDWGSSCSFAGWFDFKLRPNGRCIGKFSIAHHSDNWWDQGRKLYALWNVSIEEKYRGHGYGQEMVKDAINWVKSNDPYSVLWLHVSPSNLRAQHIYQKMGFIKIPMFFEVYGDIQMIHDLKGI